MTASIPPSHLFLLRKKLLIVLPCVLRKDILYVHKQEKMYIIFLYSFIK